MGEELKIYKGYEEYYMTGREIKEHFAGCYECFGRHQGKARVGKRLKMSKHGIVKNSPKTV